MRADHPLWPKGQSGAYRLVPGMGLVFVLLPLVATLRAEHAVGHDVVVVVLVASFAALFAWTVSRLAREDVPEGWRHRTEVLSVPWLLAVPLFLCLYDNGGWAYCFVYSLFPLIRVAPRAVRWVPVAVVAGVAFGIAVAAGTSDGAAFACLCVVLGTGATALGFSRIVEVNVALKEAQEDLARMAVAEERLRFSRDLHDLLGHSLSVIALKSEVAGRLIEADQERAGVEVHEIEAVARRALREVREAVSGYRQATLAVEVASARSALASAGVTWSEEIVDAEALEAAGADAGTEAVLAWTVREGITNVLRHSRAGSCTVEVTIRDGRAQAVVADDGVGPVDGAGPAVGGGGSGLAGLTERASAIGGTVVRGPQDGGGFRLQVSVPLVGPRSAPPGSLARADAAPPAAGPDDPAAPEDTAAPDDAAPALP